MIYIAYGSNLNIDQMRFRCPGAVPLGTCSLQGYRLTFQGMPWNAHANVVPEYGAETPVALWDITEADEAALDRYEGVHGGYYYKAYMQVIVDGDRKTGLIYIMMPNPYGNPSWEYLRTILEGYHDFEIDTGILDEALEYTRKKIADERKEEKHE